ncbi:ParB family protein [Burkholderia multivorans]|uniref:ParB family protein n=1 Tax=Burkholderia multivorans TaxID=87883 RepID=UPI00286B1BAD|nr:ParB family protein [Burkholderia multivorans]
MAELTPQDMAAKLMAAGFERSGPGANALTDPIADTPMIVTLDQLRPYDHDPRVMRNPAYEDIKASIRERGLDAPPAITRRPGDPHYIIRNGGNTRLAILRELWTETKDERFFRIPCLFRPWPARGDVVMLTGHLAENELRGGLTFIERALGIEKAREFYEQESGESLSQSELARRLTADGYPVQQSHISRMQDAVRYLLPAIPTVLYGGLGRHQVERLAVLRRACERTWERRAVHQPPTVDFGALFQDVLASFDNQGQAFDLQRVQDELVGQMADLLGVAYDTLQLEIDDNEHRQRALTSDPATAATASSLAPEATEVPPSAMPEAAPSSAALALRPANVPPTPPLLPASLGAGRTSSPSPPEPSPPREERLHGHIVSPAPTTERLQSIQRLVSEQMGDPIPDFEADVLRAIPVQAGGLYPISDVWYIEPGLDTPERLRVHIAQFAREVAEEAGAADSIESTGGSIGFRCAAPAAASLSDFGRAVLSLLDALNGACEPPLALDRTRLAAQLAPLLVGRGGPPPRLSDTGLVKLFRLLRLARHLLELEAPGAIEPPERSD